MSVPIGAWFLFLVAIILFILFVIWVPLGLNFANGITPLFFIGIKFPRCSSQTFHLTIRTKLDERARWNFCFFVILRTGTWDDKMQRWSLLKKKQQQNTKTLCFQVCSHKGPHNYCWSERYGVDALSCQGGPFLAWNNPGYGTCRFWQCDSTWYK